MVHADDIIPEFDPEAPTLEDIEDNDEYVSDPQKYVNDRFLWSDYDDGSDRQYKEDYFGWP